MFVKYSLEILSKLRERRMLMGIPILSDTLNINSDVITQHQITINKRCLVAP